MSRIVKFDHVSLTKKGRELARSLNPYIGTTEEIVAVCSLIGRLAATHHRLAETACNRELTKAEMTREARIEARIRNLVGHLPRTDNGQIGAKFQGDPRGYTVKIVVPGERQAGNTWGLMGEFGV